LGVVLNKVSKRKLRLANTNKGDTGEITMKKYWLLGYLVVFFSSVDAAPISFNFSQVGFDEGASVTGIFTGEDLNNNGQLSQFDGEVSDFMMDFSGNSLIPSFSLSFFDLTGLVYDLDGGPLGDGLTLHIEGIGADSGLFYYSTGQGPLGTDGGQVTDFINTSMSSELVVISTAPIPAAIWLFGSGLLGLVGMARRKKA
jgi:hypothetical protein